MCALGASIVNNFNFSQMGVQGDTTPPYTWMLAEGALPTGLTLAPNGQITESSINGVNLPNGTPMWFYFDGRLVGEVALVNGSAKMPPYNLGDFLSRKDTVSV